MKLSIVLSSLVALAAATPGLNIPGILNLEFGGPNGGLSLNVLSGLVKADIGGSHKASKPPAAKPKPVLSFP
ncbi:hypothetical protein FBU59_000892 [Linderina macrospora]|uniref:Uncharacterized protein n=1 Tax=Linderina macrospora TaxID=4868 RepID=A0ACC1JFJ9_9FUNG|nr:hypothetical protein FBU59_000892 [Linderina macrospora]